MLTSTDSDEFPQKKTSSGPVEEEAKAVDEAAEDEVQEEEEEEREKWASAAEFRLATIGNCVGVGNVWRFPYLCYVNGGGTFLLPYFAALILIGIPIFMLELSVGQRFAKGCVHSYRALDKRLGGVGVASTLMAYVTLFYYNIIVAWTLVYMAHSLRSPVKVRWGEDGIDAERFWDHSVLWESDGFEKFHNDVASLGLVLGSVVAWAVLFFATRNGVQSTGKVAWVTATLPYFLLLMLVIRGLTLEGASKGLEFYLKPRPKELVSSFKPWLAAANQIIYSLGVGTGQLVAFGSYNRPEQDVVTDSIWIALLNSFTSLFAGVAIFSMLGHKAQRDNERVKDVVDSGEALAFIAYPDGLSGLPGAGIWCFVFFAMLFSLALDSSMAMLESWVTMLTDFKLFDDPKTKKFDAKKRTLGVLFSCIFGFIASFIFITRPGIYWFALVDSYVVWGVFAVAVLECWGVAKAYGARRFSEDMRRLSGRSIPKIVTTMWEYVTPCICVVLGLVSLLLSLSKVNAQYEGARETVAGRVVAVILMLGPLVFMVLGALYPDVDWLSAISKSKGASSMSSSKVTKLPSKESMDTLEMVAIPPLHSSSEEEEESSGKTTSSKRRPRERDSHNNSDTTLSLTYDDDDDDGQGATVAAGVV